MVPRDSPIADGMRAEFRRLVALHGDHEVMNLYREGKPYNFYLHTTGAPMQYEEPCLAAIDGEAPNEEEMGFARRVERL